MIGAVPDKKAIARFFEAVNERDLDGMKILLSPDAEFYFPKTKPLLGRDRIVRFFSILFRQYRSLTFEVHRVICQGSQTAVHWTNHGMNRRKESYQNEGVTILEMENDRIRFISDFFKDTEKF